VTLKDAINSDRPFRRPKWNDWCVCGSEPTTVLDEVLESPIVWKRTGGFVPMDVDDILADDYVALSPDGEHSNASRAW